MEVSGFNDLLDDERPPAGESPFSAAAEFLRLDRSNAGTTSLASRVGSEGAGPATVVATLDRLPDDSVRAERYVVVLDRQEDGTWRLRSAVRTQRCRPGRGHQDFSVEPCV